VKTQQAGKGLAGVLVNCKVWKLAMAPMVTKSNYPIQTPSRVTHTCDNMVMGPVGLGNENHCAGEGQK
jgi:hypothetical protein